MKDSVEDIAFFIILGLGIVVLGIMINKVYTEVRNLAQRFESIENFVEENTFHTSFSTKNTWGPHQVGDSWVLQKTEKTFRIEANEHIADTTLIKIKTSESWGERFPSYSDAREACNGLNRPEWELKNKVDSVEREITQQRDSDGHE